MIGGYIKRRILIGGKERTGKEDADERTMGVPNQKCRRRLKMQRCTHLIERKKVEVFMVDVKE